MPANEKEIRKSIRLVRNSVKGRVHKSVLVRVNNICSLIEQVLPRANALGPGSHEMHVLSKMATDYLPDALNPYLALPRTYAERNPLSDGRTPIQVLCSQLDVMYAQMYQVADAVMRSDGDKLLANERFLEDKFGHQNTLNLPPADGAPQSQPYSTKPRYAGADPDQPPPLTHQLVHAATQLMIEQMRKRAAKGRGRRRT